MRINLRTAICSTFVKIFNTMNPQDLMRFRNRVLEICGNDETKRDALVADVLSNINPSYMVTNNVILEGHISEDMITAAGGTYGQHVFVHYWRRNNGGRFSLFNNTTPPTWNGGTFAHNFTMGQRLCNGFLYDINNY